MKTEVHRIIRMAKAIHPYAWIALACMASVLFLSVLPVETGRSGAEEYLCIAASAIGVIATIIFIRRKARLALSLVDLIVAGWYLYSMLRLWLDTGFPTFGFTTRATLALLLYAILRVLISSVRIKGSAIAVMLTGFALVEAAIGFYQVFSGSSRHYLYPVTGSFLNPGPYSAYLALGLVLVLALKKNDYYVLFVVFASALVLTMSRAAFLAVGVCALIIYRDRICGRRRLLGIIGAATAVGALLYMFKPGSADGRGVINYIGARCIAENPWFGNGIGSFFNSFARETVYLSSGGVNDALMKVDVLDYAFNDLLRVGVEQGIVGLMFSAALTVAVLRRLWYNCRVLFFGSLSLLVISLFSYPFELLPFQIISAVIVAYAATVKESNQPRNAAKKRLTGRIGVALLSATVVFAATSLYRSIKTARKAEKEYRMMAGIRDTALIKDFYAMLPYMEGDKRFLFDFGVLLAKRKRYNDSNDMLRRGALVSNDPMFLVLQGNNYRDMGAYDEAEAAYMKAWLTMPNRIYPLYRLMNLYEKVGDKEKSVEYAKKVLSFKEKIASPAVDDMKREAKDIIDR